MNDGRSVNAAFQPQAVWNENVLKQSGIQSNWEYRQYLQKNATKLMEENFLDSANDIGYYERYVGEEVPPANNWSRYRNSDLKSAYLSMEELNRRKGYNIELG